MKTTAVILPFLCAFAAAAPTCGAPVRRQNVNDGGSTSSFLDGAADSLGQAQQGGGIASGASDLLSGLGLRARQDVNDGGSSILGGLGSLKKRQNSDDPESVGSALLGGLPLKRRQNSDDESVSSALLGGLPLKARQNSDTESAGSSFLSSLGLRARQDVSDDDGKDDDSLANGVDGSHLKTDSNGQNVDAADLSGLAGGLRRFLRRAIGPVKSVPVENADNDGDDDESAANVLDGSAAGVNQNAQNLTVANLKRRQLLGGLLGGGGGETENENDGNGDDDESVLNLLNGSTADVDRNAQNLTVLRRQATDPYENEGDGDIDNDESVANVLDDSAAAVDQNAQNVDVLRRQVVPSPIASPSAAAPATAAVTPLTTPTASPSSAPIAPAPAPAAAPEPPRPVVDAGDGANNTGDNDNDNDDALLNAADNSGAEVDKNLDGVTILKKRQVAPPSPLEVYVPDYTDADTVHGVLDESAQAADQTVQGVDAAESR